MRKRRLKRVIERVMERQFPMTMVRLASAGRMAEMSENAGYTQISYKYIFSCWNVECLKHSVGCH